MKTPDTDTQSNTIRVWDPLIRLFHWSLVAAMLAAWLTSTWRNDTHQWIGLAIGVLVSIRVIWGFVGSKYARFVQFIRSPLVCLKYLYSILIASEKRYIGHNPAGALMIAALLISISATIITGYSMTTDRFFGDDAMQQAHSICAYCVILLALFHVCGVALASHRHKENLVASMITGKKRRPEAEDVA